MKEEKQEELQGLVVTDHNDGLWLVNALPDLIEKVLVRIESIPQYHMDLAKLVGILSCAGAQFHPGPDDIPEHFVWWDAQTRLFSESAIMPGVFMIVGDQECKRPVWNPRHNAGDRDYLWKYLERKVRQ